MLLNFASSPDPICLKARWLLPMNGPPIPGGLLTVHDGVILAVGANTSGRRAVDLGDVALAPGWVNAHTHLEFSNLTAPLGEPGLAFPDWLRLVIQWRREQTDGKSPAEIAKDRSAAVTAGLDESIRYGCSAVAEIATHDDLEPYDAHVQAMQTVLFRESLGLFDDSPLPDRARAHLDRCDEAGIVGGVNPHAPYTVSWNTFRELARLSAERRTPLTIHLAESPEEIELLLSGSGSLVDLLRELDAWRVGALPRGLQPLDYLAVMAKAHCGVVVHGAMLTREEVEFCAAHRQQLSVVYCPRTHERLIGGGHPLGEMVRAGVRVALGTDSRASNPDLNVAGELRRAAQLHPELDAESLVLMATRNGAEALGLVRLGTIDAGKHARLRATPIAGDRDLYEQLIWNDPGPQ